MGSIIDFLIVETNQIVNLDIAVKGQKGDDAVVEVSQDVDNIIRFGTDGKLYAPPPQIVEDTTPQLGGDLDLNDNDITGAGNIGITGEIEADIHIGSLRGEIQFKAKAGEALTKGDPVYISIYDTVGNTPIVGIAHANDSSKMPCFGLANESVSLNSSVNVVTFGTLSGLDTSGFSLGDTLYVSNTGTLANSKPAGESSLIQNIGKVQRVDNSAGSIKVGGAGRTNDVPNLNQGNVFIGNASNQAEIRGLNLDDIAETETNKHFTSGDETKLGSIESGATADQTDAEIKTAYESNADTNAFTDAEKTKLAGIAPGAEVNVNADWNAISGDAQILNKPTTITSEEQTKLGHISVTQAVDLDTMESDIVTNNAKVSNATHTGDVTGSTALTISDEAVTNAKMAHIATGTVKGRATAGTGDVEDLDIDTTLKNALNLAKSDVGLSNVDNTSDANKPISTATQTALDGKKDTFAENTAFNKNFGTTTGTVAEGNDSRITDSFQKSTDTLDNIAAGATNVHFTASDETKLDGIENNATADQTKAEIDALNINADQVDGLEASQFLRSDTGDTINVGRGNVYIENNSSDNQDGAGLTIRTSSNPSNGDENSVGSIFAVRSSGQESRLWVGQSKTTTGDNAFETNSATFSGNITIESGNNYYMSNNANIFHGINYNNITPTATATSYYAIFGANPVTNTNIYSYTTPTSSTNTGIKLLQAGKYKVSYTLNWINVSYNNRINFFSRIMKHSSAITPTMTEFFGTRSFDYARDDSYAKYATTTCVTVIDVAANEYIKCQTNVAKSDSSFNDTFDGINQGSNSSIVIEFLGNI